MYAPYYYPIRPAGCGGVRSYHDVSPKISPSRHSQPTRGISGCQKLERKSFFLTALEHSCLAPPTMVPREKTFYSTGKLHGGPFLALNVRALTNS